MLIPLPGGAAIEADGTVVGVTEGGGVRMHTDQALSRLVEYWQKPVMRAILRTYTDEVQELETALWDVLVLRFLDYAEGAQLDTLGRVVGERRGDKGDAAYRVRLTARILINSSFGRPADVFAVLKAVTDAGFTYREFRTASFQIQFTEAPEPVAVQAELPGLISETRAAGVGASVSYPVSANVFNFSDAQNPGPYGTGLGFSDAFAGTPGGDLSSYARA